MYIPARGSEPRPILVLFDGQNVFEDEGSFAGGWHAHQAVEKLAKSRPAPIIVGIEHGGETRAEELVPFATPGIHGRADIFLDWVVRDIIPMVRHDYRVIDGPAGVLVGGASLGGLAALYAHHRRPDVVGGALAMSPSLWVGRGALLSYVEREPVPWTSKIYLDTGANEGGGRMEGAGAPSREALPGARLRKGQAPGPHRQARRSQREELAPPAPRGPALLLPAREVNGHGPSLAAGPSADTVASRRYRPRHGTVRLPQEGPPSPESRVQALAPLLQAGDNAWQIWPQFYSSLLGHSDLRVDALEAFSTHYWMKQVAPSRGPRLDFLVNADPRSWLVVRAQVALAEGLEARGSGTEILDGATFSARLGAARVDAERVAQAEPQEAPALVILMRIARGTGDEPLGEWAYRQAVTNVPGCFATELAHNSALSQRWGGSHEAQLAHSRAVASRAPDGHLLAGLPINALYFQMSHLRQFDKNDEAARAFAASPQIQGELAQACARSVDVPSHVPSVATFTLRTMAAVIGWQGNNAELTRRQLAGLGDVFLDNPWHQMTAKPRAEFDRLRKVYGLG